MATALIPYRGDLVTARLSVKAAKKKSLRSFKRKLLKEWNLASRLPLWTIGSGYVNDKARNILGFKKDFLESSEGINAFGVHLVPAASVDKVLALSDNQKDFLRSKCLGIFNKYGKRITTTHSDGGFDFKTFKEIITEDPVTKIQTIELTETNFIGESDEELAGILYNRIVMYMVDNDSTDSLDNWGDINEGSDFFNSDIRSTLKSYSTTFTNSDIRKMVNDRLFKKRKYKTTNIGASAFGIDMKLFNELLDDGLDDTINESIMGSGIFWRKVKTKYTLNAEAVRDLPADEFLIFIQTHLDTWYDKIEEKKKWYQKGILGAIFVVVIVAIAVVSQQYYLVGVALGTVLVVAGMVISIVGAVIGNQVMMVGGQIVSLVGAGVSVIGEIAIEQAAMETVKGQLISQGFSNLAIQEAMTTVTNEFLLNTMLGLGKFAVSTVMTLDSLFETPKTEELGENITPAEKMNEVYVADDMSWDFVQQFLPDFIIANALRLM